MEQTIDGWKEEKKERQTKWYKMTYMTTDGWIELTMDQ